MWLALVPLGVALILGLLLLPRRAAPESVPLPVADPAVLARTLAQDQSLASAALREPLPGAVRALGSAIRAFHTLEASDAQSQPLFEARREVDRTLVAVLDARADGANGANGSSGANAPIGVASLLSLRAVQLEAFLTEVQRFEATGERSAELDALAGSFVRSLTQEGWCQGHTLAPDASVLRVMYKHVWNTFLGLDTRPELRTTLDEERVLYAFYLSHAHPSKNMREAIAAARRGARDARSCQALAEAQIAATEEFRLQHITRLAAIDPAYPAQYARGVASFRRGDFGAATTAFSAWLQDHPDGPLTLRAQNFLRAAAAADRVD